MMYITILVYCSVFRISLRTTGRKKKLNSYLRFPEELDVGIHVGKEGN